MSFRRKVVVAAALAYLIWGFARDASAAEPRDKPLPPFAKFAKGLFSGNQESDPTSATGEVLANSVVTTYPESTPTGSPQGTSGNAKSESTATTDSAAVVSPTVFPPRQEDSSLRATVEKLKALRRDDSTFEANQEQGISRAQTAETASRPASQPTVDGTSEPVTEIPLSELPSADLKLYSTPPYPTKITHRGITDHAPTRTESLHNALHRLQQERQEAEISPTNLAENQLRDPLTPSRIAEAKTSPHGDVPIVNAIAGDLEARRPAPVIRSSDLASRPSRQSNPLRERGPDYRSLRVSDWQEPSTRTASMAIATSPSTIHNRFVDVSDQADEAVVASPKTVENAVQFTPPSNESYFAESFSSPMEETSPNLTQFTRNTVHNPYITVVENNSPPLNTEQTGAVSPTSETYFATPRETAYSTENNARPNSEEGYTKIVNDPEAPTANFVFNSRLPEDEESTGNMVSNTWITPVASMTDEDPSPQPALPEVSHPVTAAQSVPAEKSESDSPPTDSKETEPPPTSYRTMTIPTQSRSLIRPGRVVEIVGPPANLETTETPTSNLEPEKQEVVIDRSSGTTTQEHDSRQKLPRRGPVIKPSPRPIALP